MDHKVDDRISQSQYAQSASMTAAAPVGLLAAIMTFVLNLGRADIPLVAAGDMRAMGALSLIYAVLIALVGGVIGYYLGVRYKNEHLPLRYRQSWKWSIVPIVLAYTVIVAFIIDIFYQLLDAAFASLFLPTLQAVFLIGILAAVVTYITVETLMRIDLRKVLVIIFTIMVGGIYYAAITIDDPLWWQESFSYLGTQNSNASAIFNITFVLAGILMLVLQQYFMYDFHILRDEGTLSPRVHQLIGIGIFAFGFLIAGVGVFPWGASPLYSTLHNLCAYTMAMLLFLLMVSVYWVIPGLERTFYLSTVFFIAALLATGLLMVLGRMNTTQAEINGLLVGGAWIALLVNNVDLLARRLKPPAFVD